MAQQEATEEADDARNAVGQSEDASRHQEDPGELFIHTLTQSLMDDRFRMALTEMQRDVLSAPGGEGVRASPWYWNCQSYEDAQAPDAFTVQLENALRRLPADKSDVSKQSDEPDFATLVSDLGFSGYS
mmetsp:Transcript_12956/g.21023  ORF Transcript_12956/g.21023 Transcript_12956/m.21023 type:complete len:129 (-) Transcript_12956:1-387(-)